MDIAKSTEMVRKAYPRGKYLIWDTFDYRGRQIFTIGGPKFIKGDTTVFFVELKPNGNIEIFDFWETFYDDLELGRALEAFTPIDVRKEDR